MNRLITICLILLTTTLLSCNSSKKSQATSEFDSFGQNFSVSKSVQKPDEALKTYEKLPIGDSIQLQIEAPINEVCAKKGCFMVLDLGQGETARVTFKDYGFFVPKDAAGRETIINGWAHKKETSVAKLQHYAEDAGKSPEEIASITEPEIDYTFVADGVLIKK